VRAPEPLRCWRVVARPDALDALDGLEASGAALRLAPDDVLVITGGGPEPLVGDPDAIVVTETGFVGWQLDEAATTTLVRHHVEWDPSTVRPTLAQGLVAGVPAKLWLRNDGSALLVCAAAYAAELQERLA
jgi:hypothetical protein